MTTPATAAPSVGDVSETLLVPLYCRAIESRDPSGLLHDARAQDVVESLDRELPASPTRLRRKLREGRLPPGLATFLSLRTRRFDRHVLDFLVGHPDGTVVNLGCGLCTRFDRVDNGRVRWFDIDLPDVIAWRRQHFVDTERRTMVAADVLDTRWLDAIGSVRSSDVLFLAEGLFMYLPADPVKKLVSAMQRRFPGSELIVEVFNARWLPAMDTRWLRFKFRRQLHLGERARFISGWRDAADFESSLPGTRVLDEWTPFDDAESERIWFHVMGHFDVFRRMQWVLRVHLGAVPGDGP